MNDTQKVTLIIDMYRTDSYEYDAPYVVYQVTENYMVAPEKSEGVKRYRVEFSVPKILRNVDENIDRDSVTVREIS